MILQQAETAKLVEKVSRMQFGRRLTKAGRDFLDSIEIPVIEEKKIEKKAKTKEVNKPEVVEDVGAN